jgi:hypothetical protein
MTIFKIQKFWPEERNPDPIQQPRLFVQLEMLQQGHTPNLGEVWTRVTTNERGELAASYRWATG